MSSSAGFARMLLNVATWAAETTNPNAGAGTAGAVGSFWQREGSFPATPVETYLKLNATAKGWAKQNTVNLRVFNILAYGGVANGVTSNNTAFAAALAAAVAAGGGIIYFPPATASYAFTKPGTGLGSMLFDGSQNITVMGDGFASHLEMVGSSALGTWYLSRLRNGAKGIKFVNLYMSGANITSPDPTSQNIGIYYDDAGVSQCEVEGCWFGRFPGDAIDVVGRVAGELVVDIKMRRNLFNLNDGVNGSRAAILAQRFSRFIEFTSNWITGAHDNQIDFEPTGGGGDVTSGPSQWIVAFNQISHGTLGVDAITMSGIGPTQLATRNKFVCNVITHGGGMTGINFSDCEIIGNVCTVDSISASPVISGARICQRSNVHANVAISQNNTNTRKAIAFADDSSLSPIDLTISDNICETLGNNSGGRSIDLVSVNRCSVVGNVCLLNVTADGTGVGIGETSNNNETDQVVVAGNLIIGTGNVIGAGVNFHASPNSVRNTSAWANYFENVQVGVAWDRGAAETFLDWRLGNLNNQTTGATTSLQVPATNVGCSMEGVAGPGSQIADVNVAGGPVGNVSAPTGSLCCNTLGGQATTLWYKETGSGVSGGTALWLGVGGSDQTWGAAAGSTATAARFFVPGGLALAVESTIQVQTTAPRACVMRNLRIKCVAGTGSVTNTYSLRRNGSNVSLNVAINNTSTGGTNTGSFPAFVAGDLISFAVSKGGAPTTPQTNIVICFEMI